MPLARLSLAASILICVPLTASAEDGAGGGGETVQVPAVTKAWKAPTKDIPEHPSEPDMTLNVPPYELDSIDYNFPTGLRIIFQADHTHPTIAITGVMDTGSADDPVGKEGIAHFVEHLWFR